MAVVIETTLGDITIDLYIDQRPKACLNFLKLCRMKYYNFNLFHTVNNGFIAQTGDPTGSRIGGESIWGVMEGPLKRYFEAENTPRIKHTTTGLVSFVGDKDSMIGSQFFITLAPDLTYLDAQHCVFGEVADGFEILRMLNEAICDNDHRPYQDIRITHTVVLEDPFPDPENLKVPDASPEPTAERLQGGRIAPDEEIDETDGKTVQEVQEIMAEKEAKARATILEMIGDIPDAEMAPPENVLFVCKLNPVTNDDDLEIIFSRFGKIKTCEVIRDKKSGDSLQYAFVEFTDQKSCEDAYFKMDNVLIDDRRIHVDFSQSVAKVKWHGKGRGVTHYNERGERQRDDPKNDMGNGRYQKRENDSPKIKFERNSDNRQENKSRSNDKHENGNNRNRNYDSRENRDRQEERFNRDRQDERFNRDRQDERFNRDRQDDRFNRDRQGERDERYRQNDRNRYQDYRQENKRQRSRSRENERSWRNRSRSVENTRPRQEEREYRKKEERSRSKSRDNQRLRQVERENYKKKEVQSRSRSRENQRSRQRNMSPDQMESRMEYRRKQERSTSRSRENQRFKQRNLSPEENRKREAEKLRYERSKKLEDTSEEDVKKKKKSKKKKKNSSDGESSVEETTAKKSKKSKKKKSKKKKQHKGDSDLGSESDCEERKKSKKKKKKSKKHESSSDSDSDSDSDAPRKKKSKKR